MSWIWQHSFYLFVMTDIVKPRCLQHKATIGKEAAAIDAQSSRCNNQLFVVHCIVC